MNSTLLNEAILPGQRQYPEAEVRPYSLGELCRIYGVSQKTMLRWLKPFEKEIGIRRGRYYNVNQVETIIIKLGLPYFIK